MRYSLIQLIAMGLVVPTGPMQTYKDTRTGETLVDDQGGPRVAGARGYGLTDDDDGRGYNGDDQDYSGREERVERRLKRLDRREDRHDDRLENREDRHDDRVDRKRKRLESKLDDDENDRGGKKKVKPKLWYEQNTDWRADARGGVANTVTGPDQTHTITIKVGAKSFKPFDMSFSGSTDTDAVVTRIEFGEEAIFSSPDGVSISLWDADSTLRNFLANTEEITGGLDITITFISGSGTPEAPKRIRAALMGFKMISRRCDD